MLVDLHTHSTSSDGTYTPAKLVEAAAAAKIGVLALTDHDSVNGIVQAETAAVNIKNAPRIIRGVELGTQAGEASVHILGYHIDISNERLLTKMHEMRHARELRLQKILKKIAALGYYVEVAECDPDNRAVGRPHVAKALVAKGYFATVQEAFDVLLKRGRPGYEPQPKLSPEEAVELLHQAGGLAVLAHPSELEDKPLVNCLMKNVKFDGIEVYHPSADINEQKYWLELAQNFDLLVSGGSDFHGVSGRFPEQLGIFEVLYTNVKNVIEYKQ